MSKIKYLITIQEHLMQSMLHRKITLKVGDLLKVQGIVKEGYMEEYSVKEGQTFKTPAGSLTVTQITNVTITKLGTTDLPKPY